MNFELRREVIEEVGENWESISELNALFQRLENRKADTVVPEGVLAQSKIAWKIAVFEQSVLYRVVMISVGCAELWNVHNVLGSTLCARAVMETIALFFDFKDRLIRLCAAEDRLGIDQLVMNRIFNTRLEHWLADYNEDPDVNIRAVNVLTMIDRLDIRIGGSRAHYDRLSEMCHPNSAGHYLMFATLNHDSGVVTFSDTKNFVAGAFANILGSLWLVGLVEIWLNEIDTLLPRIAALRPD